MVQQGHTTRRGLTLRYRIDGDEGKPWLTFLHSLATSLDLWAPQAAAFAGDYRVLRLDFRGHGGSTVAGGAYGIEDLALDVVAVWDAVGARSSSVVGLSLGGMTAIGLALDHPGRVDRLVAADCRADAPDFFRNMWDARRQLLAQGGMAAVAEATLPTWLTPATREGRPALVAQVRGLIEATDPQGYAGATAALQGLDYRRRLPAMTRPTLFLCGAEDGPHPAEMQSMAQVTPGSRYVEIAEASHISNLEQAEAFNAAVAQFLASPHQPFRAGRREDGAG